MPELDHEVNQSTWDLLERAGKRGTGARWWVVLTRSRHEKELARRLSALSIDYFLPTFARPYRCPSGKSKTSQLPLFPGYVFIYCKPEDSQRAVISRLTGRCLKVPDQDQLTHDLRNVYRLIASGAALTLEKQLHQGDHVRVRIGPMKNFVEGTLIREPGRNRLVVNVDLIGQGASFEAPDYLFEKADKFVYRPEDLEAARRAARRKIALENPPPAKVTPWFEQWGSGYRKRAPKRQSEISDQKSEVSTVSRDAQSSSARLHDTV